MSIANPALNDYNAGTLEPQYILQKYGFSIPDQDALDLITRYSPIVEIGAGLCYWAWLLNLNGCRINCSDIKEWDRKWYPSDVEDFTITLERFPKWTLMTIWPIPCLSFILSHYKGNRAIYVGPDPIPSDWVVIESMLLPKDDILYALKRNN